MCIYIHKYIICVWKSWHQLLLLLRCISYFSVSVIRHHDWPELKEERDCFGLWLQSTKNPSRQEGTTESSRHSSRIRKLRAHMVKSTHRERKVEVSEDFKVSVPTTSDVLPPTKPNPLSLPIQYLQLGLHVQTPRPYGGIFLMQSTTWRTMPVNLQTQTKIWILLILDFSASLNG